MIIRNGLIFGAEHQFIQKDIAIDSGKIAMLAPNNALSGDAIDASDAYVIPGFVDIHIHGAAGSDFCDGTQEDFLKIASYLGSQGVTSFCGTSMALAQDMLEDIFSGASQFIETEHTGCAVMRGINMEGPFFSKEKKGAQYDKYIISPDMAFFRTLNEKSGNHILLIDIAPELEGAIDFIREASREVVVSLAHTTADYNCAQAAFLAGASHTTHLFNAMKPFSHRDPGLIGASIDYAAHVELISDGIHLHPATVRAAFKWFEPDRICLISDAMRACGMPDGDYSLGGQAVTVSGGKATLASGVIAGSATNLADCFRKAVSFGIPLETAVQAATENPARAVGLFDQLGSIEAGKRADLVILNRDLSLRQVIIGGKAVSS